MVQAIADEDNLEVMSLISEVTLDLHDSLSPVFLSFICSISSPFLRIYIFCLLFYFFFPYYRGRKFLLKKIPVIKVPFFPL